VSYPLGPSSGGASSSELPSSPLDVAIVGAGRVGCSIGRALLARGHRVVAASVANSESARRVLDVLGHVPIVAPEDAPLAANVVVLAVPDDALEATAKLVARGHSHNAVVIHTSGIHGTGVLTPCGPNVAAVHPAQTIPEPSTDLAGVYFGVTAPEHMRDWSAWFVGELGGIAVAVAEEQRALYHAALSMASNFTVALAGDSADLLGNAEALAPLLRQTIENVIRLGADAALTGPVVRGDSGTVRAHIAALTTQAPHMLESYVANARRALDRAVKAGRLDAGNAKAVSDALEEAMVR
jgi:predicted short-subunit dehydrogenase-like oxidoreductase (DUF2520 family)